MNIISFLRRKATVLFLLSILFFANPLLAQKPDLSTIQVNASVYSIAMDSTYVYIGGSFKQVRYLSGSGARLTATSDQRDPHFPYFDGVIFTAVADGSGGWYIGGKFSNVAGISRSNLVHITATGGVDLAWNPNANDTVFSIGKFGNDVYIGGSFTSINGMACNRMAKLHATSGTLNTVFNANANATVYSIAVDATDLYVGGLFTVIGGQNRNYIAKLNSDGYAYPWDAGANGIVQTLALLGADVFAGGSFTQMAGQVNNYIAKLAKADAVVNSTFRTNTNPDNVVTIITTDGGDLFVGGDFTTINGQNRRRVAKLNWDGNAYGWNPDVAGSVRAIAVNNNNVYVGGSFTTVNSQSRPYLARVDKVNGIADNWNPVVNDVVNTIATNGNDVFIGGMFTTINALTRNRLARISRINGLLDRNWNPDVQSSVGYVQAIMIDGADIYIAGDFDQVGGSNRKNLARLKLSDGTVDTGWVCDVNRYIRSLAKAGSFLYVSGVFSLINGQNRAGIAQLNAADGTVTNWNAQLNGEVYTMAVKDNYLYAGGNFSPGLARFDIATGTVDTNWVQTGTRLICLTSLIKNNSLYFGGSIISPLPQNNVYRFNTNGASITLDTLFKNLMSPGQSVLAMSTYGSDLFVGGPFTVIGGQNRNRLAKLNDSTGAVDTKWNPNLNNEANTIVAENANVYAGGQFSNVGGFAIRAFVKIPVTTALVWKGVVSNEWGHPANWNGNWVPAPGDSVVIPAGTLYIPDISGASVSVKDLTIQTGASLQIGNGTLSVTGTLNNNGTINASTGNVVLSGNSAQQLNGTGIIENLCINNSAGVSIASGNIGIIGTLSVTSGTLTTNGLLTLKSTATATARVAALTGTPVSGNVTVERYIPAKTSRKWSFLASPVSGSTIRNGWQDDIFITGPGTGGTICGTGGNQYNANGFDVAPLSNPSMFVYNATPVNNTRWVSVANTIATNLTPGTGYRINIRGPRSTSANNCTDQLNTVNPPPPAATTLSVTGTLMQGDVNVPVFGKSAYNAISGNSNAYTLIGNPYASEISLQSFYTSNIINNITSSFWFYTPQNIYSNYCVYNAATQQALDFPSGYSNGSVADVIVASGQAFMMERTDNNDGNVTFSEIHKLTTATPGNSFYRTATTITDKARIKLGNVADSNINSSIFINYLNDPQASDTSVTTFDSYSFNTGFAFYIASLKRSNVLAIQTKSAFSGNDTVKLVFKSNTGNYKLSFSEYDQFITATEIKLIDNFTGTITDVRQNPEYSFSVTSDTASYGSSRFRVVFRSATLPISGIALNGTSRQEGVQLNWVVLAETDMNGYVAERSSDGRVFTAIGQVKATGNNNSNHNYTYLDTKPLSNTSYYRIRAIGNNGDIKYSSIIKIQQGTTWSVQLYPNPVKDQLNITVNSNNRNDVYTLRIINVYGQEKLRSTVKPLTGKLSTDVRTLLPGVYQLQLVNSIGEVVTEKFIKQ